MTNDPIEHVVVLMLENSSFDRTLGGLSGVITDLCGVDLNSPRSNPDYPDSNSVILQTEIERTQVPLDLGHEFDDVTRQLESLSGFVVNFKQFQPKAPASEALQVMGYFGEKWLHTVHTLAKDFLICDHWFSSVPGPTWPNRFFVHSGTSLGHVDMPDGLFHPHIHLYDQPTIYQRLSEKEISWKIYFGDVPQSLAMVKQLEYLGNYHLMDKFYEDARGLAGEFPQYAFIEPNYFGANQNDGHPPTDLRYAEQLLAGIFNALRQNEALWKSTLLVLLFDEHGGFYDHLNPPATVPPDSNTRQFGFDRLGVRVPAVLISPWVDKGVNHTIFDHTSLLKYVCDKWGIEPLGARTAVANTFTDAIRSTPREDCISSVMPSALPENPEIVTRYLNSQQLALAGFTHHLEANIMKNVKADIVADRSKAMAGDFLAQSKAVSDRISDLLESPNLPTNPKLPGAT